MNPFHMQELIPFVYHSNYSHLNCYYLQSVGVGHSAKTALNLVASVLLKISVITLMGAVSGAVTRAIKESSAPKVVHLHRHIHTLNQVH